MNAEQELEQAQRIYKDILLGYSEIKVQDGETIYIKHLSDIDHGWMKDYKKQIYEKAKEKGIFTEKDKLESLSEQGLWDKENNRKLEESRGQLSRLHETKAKLVIGRQKKQILEDIEKIEAEVNSLEEEKNSLIGVTCENYSEKKVTERYLYHTLFKNKELEERYFTEEEYEEVEDTVLTSLIILNNEKMQDFLHDNLKRISAAPFFLNSIMISESNPMVFFGKPIVSLSNYQIEIFSTAIRFKSIIEKEGKTPPPLSTLTECVRFYEQSFDIAASKKDGDKEVAGTASTLVGATEEELRQMAEKEGAENVVTLKDQAKKIQEDTGKKVLDIHDMLKIHGV